MAEGMRLLNRDCLEGMREVLDPGSVDLVVTSPPYNLDIKYNEYDDSGDRESYLEWMDDWAGAVHRVLAEQGSLFLNIGSKPSDPWVPHQVLEVMGNHFELQNEIHWIKSIAVQETSYGEDIDVNVGHYKPINSDRFVNQCHEYVFHLTKSGDVPLERTAIGVPYKDKSNLDRWDSATEDLRCRGNTWYVPYETIQDREDERPHPASFPSKLAEMAMRLHGLDNLSLVMDPFLGIGNSARAAARLKKKFIGFEIDEEYLEEARRRVGDVQVELFD